MFSSITEESDDDEEHTTHTRMEVENNIKNIKKKKTQAWNGWKISVGIFHKWFEILIFPSNSRDWCVTPYRSVAALEKARVFVVWESLMSSENCAVVEV